MNTIDICKINQLIDIYASPIFVVFPKTNNSLHATILKDKPRLAGSTHIPAFTFWNRSYNIIYNFKHTT